MKISTQQYIDKQVEWLKDRQDIQFNATKESTRVYSEVMDNWKTGHNEWKARMEEITKNTITRREAWIFMVFLASMSIGILGLIVSIWTRIK